MNRRSVVNLICGKGGAGKSWSQCRYIVDEVMPETDYTVWTNLPLNIEEIGEYCAEKHGGAPADYTYRVNLIDQDELKRWAKGESGPWEYFNEASGRSLDKCLLIIDEVHNYAAVDHNKKHIRAWQDFLGELRHRGARAVFISQHVGKVHKVIIQHAGTRTELIHSDDRVDPLFHIPLGAWYELRAKLTGIYLPAIWEQTGRYVGSKFVKEKERFWYLTSRYFKLYDSYSAPIAGGKKGGPEQREYQRRSFPGLLLWFGRQHFMELVMRAWVILVPAFLLCGGGGWAIGFIIKGVSQSFAGTSLSHAIAVQKHPTSQPASRPSHSVPAKFVSPGERSGFGSVAGPTSRPTSQPAPPPPKVSHLVYIGPDRCGSSDGETIGLRRSFTRGALAGWRVEIIDFHGRSITVSRTVRGSFKLQQLSMGDEYSADDLGAK